MEKERTEAAAPPLKISTGNETDNDHNAGEKEVSYDSALTKQVPGAILTLNKLTVCGGTRMEQLVRDEKGQNQAKPPHLSGEQMVAHSSKDKSTTRKDVVFQQSIPVGKPPDPQSRNIVHHSLTQQLGRDGALQPPNYKLATERMKNRELFASRVEKWSGDPDHEITPTVFELPLDKSLQDVAAPNSNWIQFVTAGPGGLQIDVDDNYLWASCYELETEEGESFYKEVFYTFNAPEFKFKIAEIRESHGFIRQTEVLKNQGPRPNEASDFIISLDSTGVLKAFDMEKGSTTKELQLTRANGSMNLEYKEFIIRQDEREILIFGYDKEEKTRAIMILHFPPWWNSVVSIIYISDKLNIALMVEDDYCFIKHGKSQLLVTAWKSFLETATPLAPTPSKSKEALDIENEWILNELPTGVVQLSMPSKFYEFYNFVTPMVHINSKQLGNQLHAIFHGSENGMCKIFRLDTIDDDLGGYDSIVLPFPDETPRLLVSNPDMNVNREVVLTFKRIQQDEVDYDKIYPFRGQQNKRDDDSSKTNDDVRNPCQCVIALDYCKHLDLLAVLFAEGDTFQIKLYLPATLQFFLALPIILRERTTRHKVSDIELALLDFKQNFVVVNMLFKKRKNETYTVREVYFCRLMSTYDLDEPNQAE